MTIALDLGSTHLRSLRVEQGRLKYRAIPAMLAEGPYDEAFTRALDRLQRGYVQFGSRLLLVGETAQTFAPFLNTEPRPLLRWTTEPAQQVVQECAIQVGLGRILPQATSPGYCVLTVAHAECQDDTSSQALEHVCQLVRESGYHPVIVPSALGVVLAGGHSNSYSAIGLSFGAAAIELSVVRQGREIGHLSLPWGGDWIDEQLRLQLTESRAEVPSLETLRQWKELHARGATSNRLDYALPLELAYRTALDRTIREAVVAFGHLDREFAQPLDFLCAGRATLWGSFLPLLSEMLDRHRFPIRVRDLKTLPQVEMAVLKGLLIHAELERVCQPQAA